jgi:hypothetical protein
MGKVLVIERFSTQSHCWPGTDIYRAEEALFIARMTEKSLEGLDKKVI